MSYKKFKLPTFCFFRSIATRAQKNSESKFRPRSKTFRSGDKVFILSTCSKNLDRFNNKHIYFTIVNQASLQVLFGKFQIEESLTPEENGWSIDPSSGEPF